MQKYNDKELEGHMVERLAVAHKITSAPTAAEKSRRLKGSVVLIS